MTLLLCFGGARSSGSRCDFVNGQDHQILRPNFVQHYDLYFSHNVLYYNHQEEHSKVQFRELNTGFGISEKVEKNS